MVRQFMLIGCIREVDCKLAGIAIPMNLLLDNTHKVF